MVKLDPVKRSLIAFAKRTQEFRKREEVDAVALETITREVGESIKGVFSHPLSRLVSRNKPVTIKAEKAYSRMVRKGIAPNKEMARSYLENLVDSKEPITYKDSSMARHVVRVMRDGDSYSVDVYSLRR